MPMRRVVLRRAGRAAWYIVCDSPLWCAPGAPAKPKSKSQVAYIGISAMTCAALQMSACVTTSSCACEQQREVLLLVEVVVAAARVDDVAGAAPCAPSRRSGRVGLRRARRRRHHRVRVRLQRLDRRQVGRQLGLLARSGRRASSAGPATSDAVNASRSLRSWTSALTGGGVVRAAEQGVGRLDRVLLADRPACRSRTACRSRPGRTAGASRRRGSAA